MARRILDAGVCDEVFVFMPGITGFGRLWGVLCAEGRDLPEQVSGRGNFGLGLSIGA